MTQEVVDTVAVVDLAVVEAGVVLAEAEDLPLVGAGAVTAKCFQPSAVTAKKSARFLLNPQTANRCIVAIVLRKWAGGAIDRLLIDLDLTTGLPVPLNLKALI